MASHYQALLQERADLLADARVILAGAEAEDRPLTTEERRQHDAILGRLDHLAIALREEEARREAERGRPGGPRATLSVLGASPAQLARLQEERGTGPARSPRFADLFGAAAAADRGGFTSFGEYATAIHGGLFHPSMQALMMGGDGNGTGFLIPGQFAAELLDQSLQDEIVRPRARIEPMTSDTKTIAGLTHGNGTQGPYGGLGGWTKEAAEITVQDPDVRAIQLHAHAVKVLVQISNEALADGTSIDKQLSEALPKALGWHLDLAYLTGTGAGQPLGVLNAPCTITVAKESGQAADTVTYPNLAKMFARLHPASVRTAIWVANPTTIPQLLQLTVTVGTGGSHIPVLTESNGEFRMLTRPVVFTEKVPALGDKGDIMLCDFSQYAVGLRADVRLEKSGHVGFTRDTAYYRAVLRADGQPLLEAAYTPKNGDTVSPFVVLAERA